MVSATEAELGGLFENSPKATSARMALVDMGHSQPQTPVATDITATNRTVNGMEKKSLAIDMRFYWVRDRIQKNYFHILWERGSKKLADYFTKHHPIWHHRKMRQIYLSPTKKT